jgi:hypothetical protein
MKHDTKSIKSLIKKLLTRAQGYAAFVFIVGILAIYGFLVFQIGSLASKEPDDAAVSDQLNTLKRLRIDQATIDKIEQLEDQNVPVQALFKEARDNPFKDQ